MIDFLQSLAALAAAHPVMCACAGATAAACGAAPMAFIKTRARKLKAAARAEMDSLDWLGAEAHICAHHLVAIHAEQDAQEEAARDAR